MFTITFAGNKKEARTLADRLAQKLGRSVAVFTPNGRFVYVGHVQLSLF